MFGLFLKFLILTKPLYFKDFPFDQHEIYFELGTNNYDFYFLEPIEDMQNNAKINNRRKIAFEKTIEDMVENDVYEFGHVTNPTD